MEKQQETGNKLSSKNMQDGDINQQKRQKRLTEKWRSGEEKDTKISHTQGAIFMEDESRTKKEEAAMEEFH